MSAGYGIVAATAGFLSVGWCALSLYALRALLTFRRLSDLEAHDLRFWPRLSVIVAACDEEESIGSALATLLAQDYPDIEIIVVDDRSRDATGRIADEIAQRDGRLRVVHVRELPTGWLGKVHALDRGVASSSGAWLLFTDADVHFAPAALRKAVAHVEGARIDHLAVAPELVAQGLAQDVVGAAFVMSFLLGTRAVDVGRAGSSAFVGVGAFNLVRRTAFERTPGFAWLRLEVLDDVGLGLMLRNAGAKGAFAVGLGDVSVAWYRSLGAMARGLEKNLFGASCRYRVRRLVAIVAGVALILPAPFLALVAAPRPWMPLLGGAAVALLAVNSAVLAERTGRSILPFLLVPLGGAMIAALLVRSAWRCLRDGGVTWRGTFYPLGALREGQRVML